MFLEKAGQALEILTFSTSRIVDLQDYLV